MVLRRVCVVVALVLGLTLGQDFPSGNTANEVLSRAKGDMDISDMFDHIPDGEARLRDKVQPGPLDTPSALKMRESGMPDLDLHDEEGVSDVSPMKQSAGGFIEAGGLGEDMVASAPLGKLAELEEPVEEEEVDTIDTTMDGANSEEARRMNAMLAEKLAGIEKEKEDLHEERRAVEMERAESREMHEKAMAEMAQFSSAKATKLIQTELRDEKATLGKKQEALRKKVEAVKAREERVAAREQVLLAAEQSPRDEALGMGELGGLLQLSAERVHHDSHETHIVHHDDDASGVPDAEELGGLLQLSASRLGRAPRKTEGVAQAADQGPMLTAMLEMGYSLDELPAESRDVLGEIEELNAQDMHNQIKSDKAKVDLNETATQAERDAKARRAYESSDKGVKTVNVLTRNIEGDHFHPIDQHRTPKGGPLWDDDGKCRDSRGEEVECGAVPDGNAPGDEPPDDTFQVDDLGQCILKCQYHTGPLQSPDGMSTGEVGGNTMVLNIPIPTETVENSLYKCPKVNKGFPFLACYLEQDNHPKCKATCLWDGSANPLKPKPNPNLLNNANPADADPKSFAFSTYEMVTTTELYSCASKQRMDPLVACQVQL